MNFANGPKATSIVQEEHNEECKNCKGQTVVFDHGTGEKICSGCGIVLSVEREIVDPLLDMNTNLSSMNLGTPSSLAHHDKNLSTMISYSNVDADGVAIRVEQRSAIQRMRRWNKISNNNRSYHRNLKNAFAVLIRIKDKLSLSDTIVEKSAYYYRKILDQNLIKGRSIKGFVVACVYASCREMNVPRTIEEIAEISDTDKIFAGKCYRLLVRKLKVRLPSIDSTSHLARIANNANISEKTLRHAIQMMSQIKDDPISFGKDPCAIAVAVLYGACLDKGEKTSQSRISLAGNVSVVTLRKRFLDIKKIFPQIPNGPNDK
ncbi:MAG TPA: transcription initiation factor IIB [Nitrososphaeraceae archaeon]|jgi:transcription initiation factor TFIIB|nr:transcription initiation factor IIB [Nitrososphaeraceae archaeon]